MLNSGKKNCALRDKKINILTLVLSEKKILNEAKTITPHLQVKWSVPNIYIDTGVVNLCISLAKISTVKPLLRSHLQGKEKVVF